MYTIIGVTGEPVARLKLEPHQIFEEPLLSEGERFTRVPLNPENASHHSACVEQPRDVLGIARQDAIPSVCE